MSYIPISGNGDAPLIIYITTIAFTLIHSTSGPKEHKRVRQLERDGKMLNVNEGRYNIIIGTAELTTIDRDIFVGKIFRVV